MFEKHLPGSSETVIRILCFLVLHFKCKTSGLDYEFLESFTPRDVYACAAHISEWSAAWLVASMQHPSVLTVSFFPKMIGFFFWLKCHLAVELGITEAAWHTARCDLGAVCWGAGVLLLKAFFLFFFSLQLYNSTPLSVLARNWECPASSESWLPGKKMWLSIQT